MPIGHKDTNENQVSPKLSWTFQYSFINLILQKELIIAAPPQRIILKISSHL